MKNSLDKIIGSFILPKYPWIEDYDINVRTTGYEGGAFIGKVIVAEDYIVKYYVKPDDDGDFTVTEEMNEAENLTHTLFRMIGPDKNQYLDEIVFLVKNN